MSRERYAQQLRELENELLRMGAMVEETIGRSVQALKDQNVETAREVIRADDLVDRAQYALEEKALLLIATQQPMARDLRLISAAISIASELERMGDYAEGIAEITIRSASKPLLKPLVDIPRMATCAQQMLRSSLDAYTRQDVAAARQVGASDDEVDELTGKVQRELIGYMVADPSVIEQATNLLYVAHNLERIADRATNIAERVIFMVTGQITDLNKGDANANPPRL
ncbi:MAG TPA: phosphate signaling complex protein PhoU [Herpetosiphonaceae bacterium]|nr:phosphate signaling complex protein PhoU [Herpetosiphonaceae bacterium]